MNKLTHVSQRPLKRLAAPRAKQSDQVDKQDSAPVDSVEGVDVSKPGISKSAALNAAATVAMETAASLAPGTWMLRLSDARYLGRLDQETTVADLKPYAQKRLKSLPKNMALGQILAYTGASSLTEMTRNVGKYREKLNQLSELGTDFQGRLIVRGDEPQSSLVVLPQETGQEATKVSTFQEVVRNERARSGILSLLDNEKWQEQLQGSKLESLRPELEKPDVDVKATLTRALGQLEGGYTKAHCKRAIETVGIPLADELGMSEAEKSALQEASGLYDIGKLAVDEKILNYDGKWPEDKAGQWFAKVSNHVHPEIVEPLLEAFDLSQAAKDGILHHHERPKGWAYCKDANAPKWDGVSNVSKVIGMADTVDAMQWRKANVNRPVEKKLDRATIHKFLSGDAEKGKVDGGLVDIVFSRILPKT